MRTAATNRRLRSILTSVRDGSLVPNPAFQRRLVWSNKHKLSFLGTVLDGLPFPEIFIAAGDVNVETGEGTELIVDGQQRVTTLVQYFTGSKDLKVSGFPRYSDLSSEQKTAFLEYEVVVRDLGALSENETRDLFYRINSTSYSLNAMEVNNARFDGELKRFCDTLSEHPFFARHGVFSQYDGKRMNDVRWVLTLVSTLLGGYFNRDIAHEPYLEKYNDEFPHEGAVADRVNRVITAVESLGLDDKSRAWQKTDLMTLLVEMDRGLQRGYKLDDNAGAALSSFYARVDKIAQGDSSERNAGALEYFAATRSGTNDRSSRARRGRVLSHVLFGKSLSGQPDLFDGLI